MSPRLKQFCTFFSCLDVSQIENLDVYYSEAARFQDPVHRVDGLDELKSYLHDLCIELRVCEFEFHQAIEEGDRAFLRWTMRYAHPKVAKGRDLFLDGATELEFDGERVSFHRDYYDMGAMLYEHIPVVGSVVAWLRSRLAGKS